LCFSLTNALVNTVRRVMPYRQSTACIVGGATSLVEDERERKGRQHAREEMEER
jgi:hypothetical protein